MEKIIDQKVYYIAILLVFLFISGFWLGRSGKPYSVMIFTIHKLISLGFIILTSVTILAFMRKLDLNSFQIVFLVFTGLIILLAFVSGVLMSFEKPVPEFVTIIHKITPYMLIVSVTFSFYFILKMSIRT